MDFIPVNAKVWGTLGWFISQKLLIGLLKSPWAKDHYWRTPDAPVRPLVAGQEKLPPSAQCHPEYARRNHPD